jgi:protein-S-isoprenylcysteine O-methyltransferase Ste14
MVWSGQTEKRAGLRAELGHHLVLGAGAVIFFVPAHGYHGPLCFWYIGWYGAWVCVALIALGFAFTWRARIHIGTLWSNSVTRKADHRVVDESQAGRILARPVTDCRCLLDLPP